MTAKEAFSTALDEMGFVIAEDNSVKRNRIKARRKEQEKENAAKLDTTGVKKTDVSDSSQKTLAEHLREGCTAKRPENCKYVQKIRGELEGQGLSSREALQNAIKMHNDGGVKEEQAPKTEQENPVPLDPSDVEKELEKNPEKIQEAPTVPLKEPENIETPIGDITVQTPVQKAVVEKLSDEAAHGNEKANKALETLQGLGEISSNSTNNTTEGSTKNGIEDTTKQNDKEPESKQEGAEEGNSDNSGSNDKPDVEENDSSDEESKKSNSSSNKENNSKPSSNNDKKEDGPKDGRKDLEGSDNSEEGTDSKKNHKSQEHKVNGKTYVDVSETPFWQSLQDSFVAGWQGKDIVTSWDKITGKWDKIKGSENRNSVRNAIGSASIGKYIDEALKDETLSEDARMELDSIRDMYNECKTAAQRHKVLTQFKKWKDKYGYSSDAKQKSTEGVIKPLEHNYNGGVAPASILKKGDTFEADKEFGEDMSKKIQKQLKLEGTPVESVSSVNVGPSATVIECKVSPLFDISKASSGHMLEKLKGACGANVTSLKYADGKPHTISIQVTNNKMRDVSFASIINGKTWKEKSKAMGIPVAYGKDSSGNDIVKDAASMPHTIVTGETGSGKSVYLFAAILSPQMAKTPKQLKQIICDPKKEFGSQDGSPFNMFPRAAETKDIAKTISSLRAVMEDRIKKLGVNTNDYDETKDEYKGEAERNIREYNASRGEDEQLEFVNFVCDEVASLTKDAEYGKQITEDLRQILALGRSVGIHCTLATQRNDVASIPGSIQANAPGRVIFKAAKDDAKASKEAKGLAGSGDLILRDKDGNEIRGRGCWVTNEDIKAIPEFYRTGKVPNDSHSDSSETESTEDSKNEKESTDEEHDITPKEDKNDIGDNSSNEDSDTKDLVVEKVDDNKDIETKEEQIKEKEWVNPFEQSRSKDSRIARARKTAEKEMAKLEKADLPDAEYNKRRKKLEESFNKRIKDIEDGLTDDQIYERDENERNEKNKRDEELKRTVRTQYKGKAVAGSTPDSTRGKKENLSKAFENRAALENAKSKLPEGWEFDGGDSPKKNKFGFVYARHPSNGSYGMYNTNTGKFQVRVDTYHPKYKGVDSEEAKEADKAWRLEKDKNKKDELKKEYNNIAFGHDEAVSPRMFVDSAIVSYMND